eukprot:Rmarinus@m.8380
MGLNAACVSASEYFETNPVRFLVYVICCAGLCGLATFFPYFISSHAEGSGIPQMKTILSGFVVPDYLSLPVLVAKVLGLACAIGGGLPVGKEGPYVHIACIIASNLCRLPMFLRIRGNGPLRLQILAAAAAAGVSATFGAPMGGVLFSIEVTATYFMVHNLWKAVFAAVTGLLLTQLLRLSEFLVLFDHTTFDDDGVSLELPLFVLLGAGMGLLSSLFIHIVVRVIFARRSSTLGQQRFVFTMLIGAISATLRYGIEPLQHDAKEIMNELFSSDSLSEHWSSPKLALTVFFAVNLVLTAVSVGLPVPCGAFTPVFVLGAALGRLFGEILASFLPVEPGLYAVVGAAAMAAGVTRTVSTAVIVFELTGQIHHVLPMLMAVSTSVIIGNSINLSLYDTLIELRHLPYMPHMRTDRNYDMTAGDIMKTNLVCLPLKPRLTHRVIIAALKHSHRSFPVIDSVESHTLVGTISRRSLVRALSHRWRIEQSKQAYELEAVHYDENDSGALDDKQPVVAAGNGDDLSQWNGDGSDGPCRESGSGSIVDGEDEVEYLLTDNTAENEDTLSSNGTQEDDPEVGPRGDMYANRTKYLPGLRNHRSRQGSVLLDGVRTGFWGKLQLLVSQLRKSGKMDAGPDEFEREQELLSLLDIASGRSGVYRPLEMAAIERFLGAPSRLPLTSLDLAPFQVSEHIKLSKLHFLFTMLMLARVFVTGRGSRLVGVITKDDLIRGNFDEEKLPTLIQHNDAYLSGIVKSESHSVQG